MGYCELEDVQNSLGSAELARLVALSTTGDDTIVEERLIPLSDSEIDQWKTSSWTTAQKRRASVALTIERLYRLDAKNAIPKGVQDAANTERDLFQMEQDVWDGAIYDPALAETDEELDELLNGPSEEGE